jgi:hypothetical protein
MQQKHTTSKLDPFESLTMFYDLKFNSILNTTFPCEKENLRIKLSVPFFYLILCPTLLPVSFSSPLPRVNGGHHPFGNPLPTWMDGGLQTNKEICSTLS